MKIENYLSKLNWEIRDLPAEYKMDILKDYENHFKEGLLAGKKENDIILELGDVNLIARNILEEYYTEHPGERNKQEEQKSFGIIVDTTINILNLIIVVPFVFSIHLMVICLYIIVYLMLAMPIFLCLKLLFPMLPITVGFDIEMIWLNILTAIVLSAIGYFLIKKFKKYGSVFFSWVSGYYGKSFKFINGKQC